MANQKVTDLTPKTIADGTEEVYAVHNGADFRMTVDALHGYAVNGFADYNDTTGATSLTADTWTAVPNNGAGAFTNLSYLPKDATTLMDTATGKIDPRQLALGDTVLIRTDFSMTPQTNNTALDFRYTLGAGAGAYTLEHQLGRLDRGGGQSYRFALRSDLIYMGDANTRDNLIGLEVKCSGDATLVNAGAVIQVIKR